MRMRPPWNACKGATRFACAALIAFLSISSLHSGRIRTR